MRLIEPKNWPELADMLDNAFAFMPLDEPPLACIWSVVRDTSGDDAEELRRAEAPFLRDIEAAIRRLDIDTLLVSRSPEIAYFVSLRCQVASRFVASLTTRGPTESASILAYPTGTRFLTIAEWLLLDWWQAHGYSAACALRLLEENIP